MARDGVPAWRLLLGAAQSLTDKGRSPFRMQQLVAEVQRADPNRDHSALQPIIQGMTANAKGGPRSACGEVFWRVDRGLYRLIGDDERASANPIADTSSTPSTNMDRPTAAPHTEAGRRVVLIGCVSQKLPKPALAKDLYTSPLFAKRRAYAEASGDPWYVLSAEYGVIHPEQPIAPYDRSLQNAPRAYVDDWTRRVAPLIVAAAADAGATTIEVHAGSAYLPDGLRSWLEAAGLTVEQPLAGLRIGEHLAWYNPNRPAQPTTESQAPAPPQLAPSADHPTVDLATRQAIARRLATETDSVAGLLIPLADDEAADHFIKTDPFAFLVAVIADYQIRAEWAWRLPYDLAERLGGLSPELVVSRSDDTVRAFRDPSPLHRFPDQTAAWIVEAAHQVIDHYGGDAGTIWDDTPTASQLQDRLTGFKGISQKKAAMAVEILERIMGVDIAKLEGSDIAYDVHVRRVFLRTGLADRDDVRTMVAAARELWPERPGSLDASAWHIGRTWCRPTDPACHQCLLGELCPRLISAADNVRGA